MDQPPLQCSMQQGIKDATIVRKRIMRVVGPLLLLVLFSTGALGTFAYLTQAESAPIPQPPQISYIDEVVSAFPVVALGAKAVIVIDVHTGRTLYEYNPDSQLPLASLTKVPLALAIREVLPPDTVLAIPYDVPPTSKLQGLTRGSRWRSQDLIDLTLAASSNDGAEILAAAADEPLRARYPQAPVGGAAIYRMNSLAHSLGLSHTYFINATGLDESAQQSGAYGSARDVARLFMYAASSSHDLFAATTRPSLTVVSLDGAAVTALNTDHALDDLPGLVMGKTGLTDLAGGNLAVIFSPATGHTVAAVVLGSTENGRFDDMRELVAASVKAYSILVH